MKFPKCVITTDGRHTAALLDGVFIGGGIKRLDFSTQNENGEMKSTIRVMDLDVATAELYPNSDRFVSFLAKISHEDSEQLARVVDKYSSSGRNSTPDAETPGVECD